MSEVCEFTEIKNDGACDFANYSCDNEFNIHCPECDSTDLDWDMNEGCYICKNCGQHFITEKFCID